MQVEDLSDENTVLRRKAGVGENDKVDTKDVRMQKEATIAQLRSLNALLERQVCQTGSTRPACHVCCTTCFWSPVDCTLYAMCACRHCGVCNDHECSHFATVPAPLPVLSQVADLEEERRKLRMELKFRAKYHGQHALEMGLTPDQLLLVEQYVDDIKNGRSDEARLVDQLTHRVSGCSAVTEGLWVTEG
jgi:hypothetical protein